MNVNLGFVPVNQMAFENSMDVQAAKVRMVFGEL